MDNKTFGWRALALTGLGLELRTRALVLLPKSRLKIDDRLLETPGMS